MKAVVSDHDEMHLSYGKYVTGFLGSVILTVCAYLLATHLSIDKNLLAGILGVLAIGQFFVQMFLFLHIGEERGPRLRLAAACFMIAVVLLIVIGSIWIMNNLNNRMTPQQVNHYLQSQDNL